ncbi:hypothetical protein R3W88_000812 [Solanum pinnatisectum]|uniref:Ubiquitin-like protease family profile domain-containing protein n=1 Tax=Solanum pinnatisectum TaxID=50273 RepID=A0AAV9MJB8_9SOLN|nr:hypothetical protein R3W88_000812 [Solanum pinnatisectum]
MDHAASFSIDITQLISSDRIYDSDDDTWAKNRSKFLHEPISNEESEDCGLFVVAFAEFFSDEIHIPSYDFRSDYLCNRYGALLWRYDSDMAKAGYVSENDDSSKPKGHFTPPPQNDLGHIE